MFDFIRKLFGTRPKTDFEKLILEGAQIIDVRTLGEYTRDHLRNSINIPLNSLGTSLDRIKKDKPVITCCASGGRSSIARRLLLSKGFIDVYNGGSWLSLKKYDR